MPDTVTISADVTDDNGFKLVETLVDGQRLIARSFKLPKTTLLSIATWNTVNADDGLHIIKVTTKDTISQEGSSEIRVFVNNGFDLPLEVMAPVEGMFHIDTGTQTLPPDDWSFWRQNAGSPTTGGGIENASIENAGIGNANDASAWNINLENDADAGKIVCSVAVGIVAETYAGCENGGGELGQVLIDHSGWWSGYMHLGDISVKPGDFVDEKTQLGVISDTGTDNNHLLFMVYTGNNLDGCENNPVEGGLESFNVTFIERAITLSPIAAFTGSPVSGDVPLDVQFTDGSQPSLGSSITAWNWDFGDNGATSSEQNPAHTYNLPGTFTVSLEVTDTNAGTDKEVKADFVEVKEGSSVTTTTTVTSTSTTIPGATTTTTEAGQTTTTSTTTTTIPTPGDIVQGIIDVITDFIRSFIEDLIDNLFGNLFGLSNSGN